MAPSCFLRVVPGREVLVILVFLLCFGALPTRATPPSLDSLLDQAQADEKAGRFAEAVALLQAQPTSHTDPALRHALADAQFTWAQDLLNHSQFSQALPHAQAAYALDKGDRVKNSGDDLRYVGIANLSLSRNAEAIRCFQQALPLFRQAGDDNGEARDLSNLGNACIETSRYAEAIDFYRQALPIFRQTNDQEDEASDLSNLGSAYGGLSRYAEAIDCFRQALPIHRRIGDGDGVARDLGNLGNAYNDISRYAEAIDCFQQALPIFRQQGDRDGEAANLGNLGITEMTIGQYAKAIDCFRQALPIYRRAGDRDGEASDLMNLGVANGGLRRYVTAIDFYRQALAIQRGTGNRDAVAKDLMSVGSAYAQISRYADAIGCFRQALPIYRRAGDRDGEASDLMNLGVAHGSLRRYRQAVGFYQQALPIYRQAGDRDGEAKDLGNLMRAWRSQKASRLAIFYGKQSIKAYQDIRTGLQTMDMQTQQGYLASIIGTYRTLADLLIGQGRLPEAEQVLQMLKSQELTDFVQRDAQVAPAEIPVSFDPDEQAALTDFQKYADPITKLGQQIGALQAKRGLSDAEKQQLVAWQDQLSPAQQKFQTFLAEKLPQEMADRPATPGGDDPGQAIRDARKQQTLLQAMGPGVVALYTVVEPDKYRVIVVTAKTEQAEEYPIRAEDLRRLVFAWRDALRDPNIDPRPLGERLSKILIGPVQKDLNGAQAQTLLWSLDDVLRDVPLAALYNGKHYLVEKYRTAVFTGASLPAVPAQPADWQGGSNALLALGVTQAHTVTDPAGGGPLKFPALPGVDAEMKDIARYDGNPNGVLAGRPLEDGQFTQAALRLGLAGGPAVVHIASHFDLGADYKTSFLLLGDGTPLTLDALCGQGGQIFQNVDMLTLSACQTGESVRNGDGHELESLGSLAEEQGASSILASLWPVSDGTTPLLMRAFYQKRAGSPETSKAEALRQAQLALLHGALAVPPSSPRGTALDNTPRHANTPQFTPPHGAPYAHPYYWASFVLIGNWR